MPSSEAYSYGLIQHVVVITINPLYVLLLNTGLLQGALSLGHIPHDKTNFVDAQVSSPRLPLPLARDITSKHS